MESIYTQNFTITDNCVDCFGNLKLSTLLYFAQEVAGNHFDRIAMTYDQLASRGMFWAIIRQRVSITRLPKSGETIRVETWPMPNTRVAFPRHVAAYDESGNELFRCIALWILMDLNTRAMVLPGKSGIEYHGITRGGELPSPKSLTPKNLPNATDRKVRFGQLDRNGHMNNTKYLEWAMDLLPGSFHREHPLKGFTVCYLNEAREADRVTLHHSLEENVLLVDATRPDPSDGAKTHRVFAVRAEFA